MHPPQDPSATADLALAIQSERLRVVEALAARDNVVARLEGAYTSVRQKADKILQLEKELEALKRSSTPANTNSLVSQTEFKLPMSPPLNGSDQEHQKEAKKSTNNHVGDSRNLDFLRITISTSGT